MRAQSEETQLSILGVVRNGGDALAKTLQQAETLSETVEVGHVVLATNDNTDDTMITLEEFAQYRTDTHILSLDGLSEAMPQREDRICLARNACLLTLDQLDRMSRYTLVLDLDGPNEVLPISQLAERIREPAPKWDALFANQEAGYYDIYALRHPKWCPNDCWQQFESLRRSKLRLSSSSKLRRRLVYDRQFAIRTNTDLVPVESAFGGLGLYKTSSLFGCWYSSRDDRARVSCEHVALHRLMRARGARLFIDPALRNMAPAEHLGPGHGKPFPDDFRTLT